MFLNKHALSSRVTCDVDQLLRCSPDRSEARNCRVNGLTKVLSNLFNIFNFVMTHEGNFLFRSKVAVTTTAVLLAVVLGYLDYLTGREWAISAFYLVPISLVAWIA